MKRLIFKEWKDRGTSKVKISFQVEGKGMKEAIVPKEGLEEFLQRSDWF